MKHALSFLLLTSVGLLLTACVTPTPEEGPRPTQTPPQPPSPLSPPATPATQAARPPVSLDELRAAVAKELGLKSTDLTLLKSEEVQWPDSSLGCPQKGMHYLQVITPGWRVIFEDAAGKQYDVRAPETLRYHVICHNAADTGAAPPVDKKDFGSAKDAAVNALMAKLNVSREAISVVSVEAVEWRNSCLGCAAPGERCLMVITPGYRVQLESGGKSYSVHTNNSGSRAIVCGKPEVDATIKE